MSPKSLLPARSYATHADTTNELECQLFGPDGRSLHNFGSVDLILSFADSPNQIRHKFFVVDIDQPILGLDALRKLGVVIDLSANLISFPASRQSLNQSFPLLANLPYDQMTCQDILNLFPKVTSGEFSTES